MPDTTQAQKNNTTTTAIAKGLAGVITRSFFATPFDNLAKRSQIYPHALGLKNLPSLLFMHEINGCAFAKIKTAYSGYTFGIGYKGTQIITYYYISDMLNNKAREHLGKNPAADIVSSFGTATIQTALLQIPSTIKTRLQADPAFNLWQALTNSKEANSPRHLSKNQIFDAIKKSHLFAGTQANLSRNCAFFFTSITTNNLVLDYLIKYNLLGKENEPSAAQKDFSKLMGGITGAFGAVLFDNIKTKLQMQPHQEGQKSRPLLSMLWQNLKNEGLTRNFRAAIPSAAAEIMSITGFLSGVYLLDMARQFLNEESNPYQPTSSKMTR